MYKTYPDRRGLTKKQDGNIFVPKYRLVLLAQTHFPGNRYLAFHVFTQFKTLFFPCEKHQRSETLRFSLADNFLFV